jgi:glutathione synthase/RimK-type ligase-like ATP-grasp enzyme
VRALNLSFASIDIFEVDGEFKVLEAHTAVAMDTFIQHYGEAGYQIAKEIYDKVIRQMFNIN